MNHVFYILGAIACASVSGHMLARGVAMVQSESVAWGLIMLFGGFGMYGLAAVRMAIEAVRRCAEERRGGL